MSQVQVTLTFETLDQAVTALSKLGGSPANVSAAPGKSAPTPPTTSADVKPSAEKTKTKAPAAAPATQETESSAPTLQTVADAINAALKPGPQNRPKVVAVLSEFETADGTPVTNAKVLQAKDYAEFLMKLKITLDPGAAANAAGDLT